MLNVFFYATAPLEGFVLKQIDAKTGEELLCRSAAMNALDKTTRTLLNQSGAEIVLLQGESGSLTLVAKALRSADRKKTTSFILQGSRDEALAVRQAAAWALLAHADFSRRVTDCFIRYSDQRGCEVVKEPFLALLKDFRTQINLDLNLDAPLKELWKMITQQEQPQKRFIYLVLETSLDYFNRMTGLNVQQDEVLRTISLDELSAWEKQPAAIVFKKQNAPISLPVQEAQPEKKTAHLQEQTSNIQNVSGIGLNLNISKKSSDSQIKHTTKQAPDSIDLLKCKWFKPTVACAGVLLLLLVLWLIFRKKPTADEAAASSALLHWLF